MFISVMNSVKEPIRNPEKYLDSQLWLACAGGMVQMPSLNSKVIYFPQGHAEHACGEVDFGDSRIPSLILCRVSAITYMADLETDEVFAKLRLIPLSNHELDFEEEEDDNGYGEIRNQEKIASFAKTLTQSDANNGGGFSVPRYCAETIFPKLDYSAEPPVQTILVKDVHGETWKFRHIYRGTPRRHLLTTGWSNFVNQKKLVAGDSIVFLRAENGDLCVGIRRAKRGLGGGPEFSSVWNSSAGNCNPSFGGFGGNSSLTREDESKLGFRNFNRDSSVRVKTESVIEAASLGASGKPFEVVYYPRASSPAFCVKATTVGAAMQTQWFPGRRFKMPFETEDSSRISWFMGTISSAQVVDPIRWPDSPWRLLQVAWDEPELLQNVKRVSPWLVEVVAHVPPINLSPFVQPRKKMRLPQHQADLSLCGHLPVPSFPANYLGPIPTPQLQSISENIPAGIQGARHHAQLGISSLDLHFNKLQSTLFPLGFHHLDTSTTPFPPLSASNENNEKSHWLTVGNNPSQDSKTSEETKTAPHIFLFGQLILPDQPQISKSFSGDDTNGNSSSDGGSPLYKDDQKTDVGLKTGHCKVFMESENVGRTLDLSVLGSYEELYGKLANMFSVGSSEMLSSVLYQDALGAVKHAGEEPFGEFLKTARRLTILSDSSSEDVRM